MIPSAPHSPERDDTGNVISAVDWLGNRFTIGDLVLYCLYGSNSQQVAIGRVLGITSAARPITQWDDVDIDDPLHNHKRVTRFYDDVRVRVHTQATSLNGPVDSRQSHWITSRNITSLKAIQQQ